MNKYTIICGEQLAKIRAYRRMTLRDVASKTDISHVTLMHYEKGARSLSIDVIDQICKALGKDTMEFLDECFEIAKNTK